MVVVVAVDVVVVIIANALNLKMAILVVDVVFYLFFLHKINDDQHHLNKQENQQNGKELQKRKINFICNIIR